MLSSSFQVHYSSFLCSRFLGLWVPLISVVMARFDLSLNFIVFIGAWPFKHARNQITSGNGFLGLVPVLLYSLYLTLSVASLSKKDTIAGPNHGNGVRLRESSLYLPVFNKSLFEALPVWSIGPCWSHKCNNWPQMYYKLTTNVIMHANVTQM